MTHLHIRPARVEDAVGLARVHVDTWRTTYGGIVPDEHLANLSHEKSATRWRANLENPSASFTFVAVTDAGEIVGFASGTSERENDPVYQGELSGIYIRAAYQRRGLGRRLVKTVVAWLRQEGFTNMLIWVLADNPACAFYAALGGKPVREKMIVIGGKELQEIGYGWDDLAIFQPP